MSLGYEIGFGFSHTEPRCVFGGPKNAHSLTFGALGCEVGFGLWHTELWGTRSGLDFQILSPDAFLGVPKTHIPSHLGLLDMKYGLNVWFLLVLVF